LHVQCDDLHGLTQSPLLSFFLPFLFLSLPFCLLSFLFSFFLLSFFHYLCLFSFYFYFLSPLPLFSVYLPSYISLTLSLPPSLFYFLSLFFSIFCLCLVSLRRFCFFLCFFIFPFFLSLSSSSFSLLCLYSISHKIIFLKFAIILLSPFLFVFLLLNYSLSLSLSLILSLTLCLSISSYLAF